MKVLIYGAGVLGSIYAGHLHHAGNDVTILARGERFSILRNQGLILQNARTGEQTSGRADHACEAADSLLDTGGDACLDAARLGKTEYFDTVAARHANVANDEVEVLAEQFRELASATSIPTPAIDKLRTYIPRTIPPQ